MTVSRARAIVLAACIAVFVVLVAPAVARADAVTEWHAIASDAIVVRAGQPPPTTF
jgi:hypothetical protein